MIGRFGLGTFLKDDKSSQSKEITGWREFLTFASLFGYGEENRLCSLDFFKRIKSATSWLPFKEQLAPLYRPLLNKLKYKQDNQRFLSGGKGVLIAAKNALDEAGIPFWLDFGTLLGVMRDGELIRHDTDVDIAVLHEDFSAEIRQILSAKGFRLTAEYLVDNGRLAREECYELNGVGLDIFYYHRSDKEMWCHLFPGSGEDHVVRELRMNWSGFKEVPFAGMNWLAPKDHHQRLVDTYGQSYNIPDPNFYTPNDAYNSKLLDAPCVYINHDK